MVKVWLTIGYQRRSHYLIGHHIVKHLHQEIVETKLVLQHANYTLTHILVEEGRDGNVPNEKGTW